jgi:hypothetical protein
MVQFSSVSTRLSNRKQTQSLVVIIMNILFWTRRLFLTCRSVHLILTPCQAIHSQLEMPSIQGTKGISFAGAYLGYGFHEDGFTSGLRTVADHIPSVSLPFDIEYPDREPAQVWVACFFDTLESSGGRALLGAILGLWLHLWRRVLGLVFDFSHLDELVNQAPAKDKGD